MNKRVKALYESGIKNKKFIKEAYESDGTLPPNYFSSDIKKLLFVACYYGWLVGQYGLAWEVFSIKSTTDDEA